MKRNKIMGCTMFALFIFGLTRAVAAAQMVVEGKTSDFETICCFIFIVLLMGGMLYTFIQAPWVTKAEEEVAPTGERYQGQDEIY